MSHPKFTPITSSLLARKGSAMPSAMPALRPPLAWKPAPALTPAAELIPAPLLHAPASVPEPAMETAVECVLQTHSDPQPIQTADDSGRPRKLFVALSYQEHERLAIVAVKTGLERHQIVRDALELYFDQVSCDLGKECRCMKGQRVCSA